MEIKSIITKQKETIDGSRIHTLTSLAKKINSNPTTIYFWKLKGRLETLVIGGIEFVIEPKNIEDLKPRKIKRKEL